MANKGKGVALLGLLLGGLVMLRPRRTLAVTIGPVRIDNDRRISPHFMESEFKHSAVVPEIAAYTLSPAERANLDALVIDVLEPLRAEFGPVVVVGGGRPEAVLPREEWIRRLRAAGFDPAGRSDHGPFAAADVELPNQGLPGYVQAYKALAANPRVRQVILELREGPDGLWRVHHLHVAVVTPDLPAFTGDKRAFVQRVPNKEIAPNA